MTLAEKLRALARRIKRDGVTLWFATKHPKTPIFAKALTFCVVAYALSPIDPVPDFIPIIGFLDEALVLPGLIWLAIKLIPAAVLDECRVQAAAWMEKEGRKPRTKWEIVLVGSIWLAIIGALGSTLSLHGCRK
jgi:uncharacterized membrane protein YkvA (DUF1232 family)